MVENGEGTTVVVPRPSEKLHGNQWFTKTVLKYSYLARFDFLDVPTEGSFVLADDALALASWTFSSTGGTDESGDPLPDCKLDATICSRSSSFSACIRAPLPGTCGRLET